MSNSFNNIEKELKQFKIKYHSLELYKGIIYFLLIGLIFYVSISFVEYVSYFNSILRRALFFTGIIFFLLLFVRFILFPLFRLFVQKSRITDFKVNAIITKVFPELKDKLINLLELHSLNDSAYSDAIIKAAINQKTEELKPFNFRNAIDYRNLKQTGFLLLLSVIISTIIYGFDSKIYSDSGRRLIHYNQVFVKPAPFTFELQNKNLNVRKGEKFTFLLKCNGEDIPQIIYINIGGNNFLMNNKGSNLFEYSISSVINSFFFHVTDMKYSSEDLFLNVLPKPGINYFTAKIKAPEYTGIADENLENSGDLKISEGSRVFWTFSGIDIDSLIMIIGDSLTLTSSEKLDQFSLEHQFYRSENYKVFIKNKFSDYELALNYNVEVIPDLFPEISIDKTVDSVQFSQYYFKGTISDDFGFSNLKFHLNFQENDSAFNLDIVKSLKKQEFYFVYDFRDIKDLTKEAYYYFTVTDNDVINNFKTTASESYLFKFPEKEEIIEEDKEKFKEIADLITESEKLTNEIKNDLKKLQVDDINSNSTKWEKAQQVSDILNKKNRLEDILNQIDHNNEKLNNYSNSFTEKNEDILEKQEEIQKLLDEVLSDELKKLLEEFEKLAIEFDSKSFNNLKKQMDFSLEDLTKQLDRNLEILKRMKVEQYIQNLIETITELSEKEAELSSQMTNERDFSEVFRKDTANNKRFNETRKDLQDILNLNKELKKPLNFDDFDNEYNEIDSNFKENQKNLLEKSNKKRITQSLNKTSESLKNMAFSMNQLLQSNVNKQRIENIDNLKQILSNLILFSFSEERLLDKLALIENTDPLLGEYTKMQKQLKEQSIVINDSLYALADRTSQISGLINYELIAIRNNLEKSLKEMQEGFIPNARVSQQLVMTAVNNLALLLNEALDRLEQQLANAEEGNQQCENPNKNGKKGLSLLQQEGNDLKQQLEQMIEQMKKGFTGKMSRQLSEALMLHEMMQKMLREIMSNGSVGSNARKQLQEIDNLLEENRRELINRQLGNNTLIRHNQILTRLLEAEKAETERDLDNKRESESAKEEYYSNPLKYFEYKSRVVKSLENSEKENYRLNEFYNDKLKQYISNLKDAGKL